MPKFPQGAYGGIDSPPTPRCPRWVDLPASTRPPPVHPACAAQRVFNISTWCRGSPRRFSPLTGECQCRPVLLATARAPRRQIPAIVGHELSVGARVAGGIARCTYFLRYPRVRSKSSYPPERLGDPLASLGPQPVEPGVLGPPWRPVGPWLLVWRLRPVATSRGLRRRSRQIPSVGARVRARHTSDSCQWLVPSQGKWRASNGPGGTSGQSPPPSMRGGPIGGYRGVHPGHRICRRSST